MCIRSLKRFEFSGQTDLLLFLTVLEGDQPKTSRIQVTVLSTQCANLSGVEAVISVMLAFISSYNA